VFLAVFSTHSANPLETMKIRISIRALTLSRADDDNEKPIKEKVKLNFKTPQSSRDLVEDWHARTTYDM
jgi:hypothetical protein